MNDILKNIIIDKNVKVDKNGILVSKSMLSDEVITSKSAWERIYNYDLDELKKDREGFYKDKLDDHTNYIEKYFDFDQNTIYLEIGCGPTYIGEYVMKAFDSYFVGIDFNYNMLLTLKKYFDEKGYKKYLLIYGDINSMPIKDNSVDFIYGGGVIEHFSNTKHMLNESYRILSNDGVSFNTVPAFNLWWLLRFYNNIPSMPLLKNVFEFLHIKLLKSKVLLSGYGYELSFTKNALVKLHKQSGFREIEVKPFTFHASSSKLRNKVLQALFYKVQQNSLTSAAYLVCAKK